MTRCMGCMKEYAEGVDICPHCGYARGTAAREAYHLAPESILAGKYIVGRVLGFGGFGVTYIGYDAQLDRVVAIKEFLPTAFATRMPGGTAVTVYEGGATSQFGFGLERFVQEAQRLAQFNGIPGITDIYDTFAGNNTAYIVMQYLQGSDVKQALQAGGPMPYERARDVVLHICDTLAPVHAKGIIHRDISPDNIFLTDDGEVKLLDFGAARYESSVNSKSLSVILKSGYAPEEQYRSRGDQGPWTDVYALAATFYKMLTGITPPDSMERAVKDEIREPSKLGADIPQSAENALMNALNIRKSDRTQSVQEFKEALQADGVERVKVKARRTQTGKVPLPAVVALGIAGVLIVVFIVLNATGTVNIVGGTGVPDNFGAAADGQLTVPDLTGKTEAEALALLEEAGLVLEVGPPIIEAGAKPGTVAQQEPLSGRYIDPAGTVTIRLGAGNLTEAIAAGLMPDLVGMGAVESVGYLASLRDEWDNFTQYFYEYSDSVPAGTVTRFVQSPEVDNNLWIFVSAGPGGTPAGELCAPILYPDGGSMIFQVAMPAEVTDATLLLEISADGTQWEEFSLAAVDKNYGYEYLGNELAAEAPHAFFVLDSDMKSIFDEQTENISYQLRVRAYDQEGMPSDFQAFLEMSGLSNIDELTPEEREEIEVEYGMYREKMAESGELPVSIPPLAVGQTLTLGTEGEAVALESAEILTWAEVEARIDSGELPAEYLLQYKEQIEEGYDSAPVLLKGDFKSGAMYDIKTPTHTSHTAQCHVTGEMITAVYEEEFNRVDTGEAVPLVVRKGYGQAEYSASADGMNVTAMMALAATVDLKK